MRYLIRFSYDGSDFKGYQKQEGYRTVQEELEKALMKINNGKAVKVVAAGRTDRGVHAMDQVAHLDIDVSITPYKLKRAMNSNLSDEIHINSVKEVADDYFVRYHVLRKEYHYYINMGEYNPLTRKYIYQHCYPLNVEKMVAAIQYFKGEHDFRAFVTENKVKENCVRTIYEVAISKEGDILDIKFVGNGFLRYQVRNMVGILIKVGTEKIKVDDVKKILDNKVRGNGGVTAKACGLYLVKTTLEDLL